MGSHRSGSTAGDHAVRGFDLIAAGFGIGARAAVQGQWVAPVRVTYTAVAKLQPSSVDACGA